MVDENNKPIMGRDLFQCLGLKRSQETPSARKGKLRSIVTIGKNDNVLKVQFAKKFLGLSAGNGMAKIFNFRSKSKMIFTCAHQKR